MGLFSYTIAGGGFILIGAWESLTSSTTTRRRTSTPSQSNPLTRNSLPSSPVKNILNPPIKDATTNTSNQVIKVLSFPALFTYTFTAFFSFLFIINSLMSISSAINTKDKIGSPLQLQVLSIASLFLLYSVLGLVSKASSFVNFPSGILNLVALFGFVEEFLLFYLQRKDTAGIENRYFDLMLLPISICVISTVLELKSDQRSSLHPRLARGVGLILQGMWFLQMGISFYTNWMVKDCHLIEKSRGNFTIKCKGHMEYHRGRGIATLLFNCHLALLVVMLLGVYSVVANRDVDRREFMMYKPIGEEMNHSMESGGQFTLGSDEEYEIREVEENAAKGKRGAVEMSVNGNRTGC